MDSCVIIVLVVGILAMCLYIALMVHFIHKQGSVGKTIFMTLVALAGTWVSLSILAFCVAYAEGLVMCVVLLLILAVSAYFE